ncbi:hypothetical protein R3I93_019264 [Phoxinus phoxinus]|uniref:Uncharacterized protein n=1 Tax=Phoxinus phoxinus TaxID=58324 RepID=A0AAN9CGA6_9TELE
MAFSVCVFVKCAHFRLCQPCVRMRTDGARVLRAAFPQTPSLISRETAHRSTLLSYTHTHTSGADLRQPTLFFWEQ